MGNNLIKLAIIAASGVMFSVLYPEDNLKWIGFVVSFTSIVLYHVGLLRKDAPTAFEIDSIYYFGFFITIITLASTTIYIGLTADIAEHRTQVVIQFGYGLFATAYALLARLHLLGMEEAKSRQDVDKAAERLARKVAQLSDMFGGLASNAQTRGDALWLAFEATEIQFRSRLDKSAKLFDRYVQASEARLKQAEDELEAAVKQAQAREKWLESEFSQAMLAFNAHLAQAARESLENTAKTIDQSSQQFTNAVAHLTAGIGGLQQDMETLSFGRAAQRVEMFAKSLETSLDSVQSAMDTTSENAAAAINKLAATARETHALAVKIADNLDSLKNLDGLVAQIGNAGAGLEQLSKRAVLSGDSLHGMDGAMQEAASASGQLSENLHTASTSLAQVEAANRDAAEAIGKQADAARKTRELAVEIAANLNDLKNFAQLNADKPKFPPYL